MLLKERRKKFRINNLNSVHGNFVQTSTSTCRTSISRDGLHID